MKNQWSSSADLLLLGLLFLLAKVTFASASVDLEVKDSILQCLCIKTTSAVHPKFISSLEVIRPGPQCSTAEMIATLKNGRKVCLDLQAPIYKNIIKKMVRNSLLAA